MEMIGRFGEFQWVGIGSAVIEAFASLPDFVELGRKRVNEVAWAKQYIREGHMIKFHA